MEQSPLPKEFSDADKAVFENNRGYQYVDSLIQHTLLSRNTQSVNNVARYYAEQQQVATQSRRTMPNAGSSLADSNAWLNLEREAVNGMDNTISGIFGDEGSARMKTMTATLPLGEKTRSGDNMIMLDASKTHVTAKWNTLFQDLLKHVNFDGARRAMFAGEAINTTENRSVLHIALREMDPSAVIKDSTGEDVMPKVRAVRDKMKDFSTQVREGKWVGFTNKRVTHVVNIGIGGSDLGPVMATEALKPYAHKDITMHFVSNVDGAQMQTTLEKLPAEETLFIVASKTFTTLETLQNARLARKFLVDYYKGDEKAVAKHFVAVSTNAAEVSKFGIDTANMFEFWDWVGGRYSMWSAIGLSIAICIGFDNFAEMLTGANMMDKHFLETDPKENIPVMMAMVGILYGNFRGCDTHAVLPYAQFLHRFPAYLQQLDMESNGKMASKVNKRAGVDVHTGPIVFGEPGTNGQHAFYQLIHQGTRVVPCDFIGTLETHCPIGNFESHKMLVANMIAQAEALMIGKSEGQALQELEEAKKVAKDQREPLASHKAFSGNRPSNTIMMRLLTPRAFGALVAAYEHKVYTQGVVWGINSFDQWGVELGKVLTNNLIPQMVPGANGSGHDLSTNALLTLFNQSMPQQ